MTASKIVYPDGATPIDPDEINGLIPDYITTQAELNTLERANVLDAIYWATHKVHSDILNVTFLFGLHRRMFNQVWQWAGKPRKSEKNIGVPVEQVSTCLSNLMANTQYWIEHRTFGWDEIGSRFHHDLVRIHPFVNGNGRHARLMTDILLTANGQSAFTWGSKTSTQALEVEGTTRQQYIAALKDADLGNYGPLVMFVRT